MASRCRLEKPGCFSTRAPAKLNLRLKVVGRRGDGYHLLSMLNVPLDYSDLVSVRFEAGNELKLDLAEASTVSLEDVTDPRDNLAFKAAERFLEIFPVEPQPHIILEKHIPYGAGLGGGSSDAAAVLRVLAHVWKTASTEAARDISPSILAEIGLQLGADVPFFVYGAPAVVTGVGERVTPITIPELEAYEALLLHPPQVCSTPAMFAAYRQFFPLLRDVVDDLDLEKLNDSTLQESGGNPLSAYVSNDFDQVIESLYPSIASLESDLRLIGDVVVSLSGSGSSVMVLSSKERGIAPALERSAVEVAERHGVSILRVKFSQRGFVVVSC